MQHNVFQSDTFNHRTCKSTSEGIEMTGETKEGLELTDEIENPYRGKTFLPIKKIIERRDSKDYPEGNNYFYRVLI